LQVQPATILGVIAFGRQVISQEIVVARLLQLFGNTSNNNAFRISILAALPPALFFLALKNEACRAILGQADARRSDVALRANRIS